MKKNNKIVKAIALAGVVIGAGALGALGGGIVADDSVQVSELNSTVNAQSEEISSLQKALEKKPEVITEYEEKIVEKNVTIEVPVEDTEALSKVCERLMYEDIQECKEEVNAEDAALKLALNEIESEYADVLEDEELVADEDDVSIVRVYDDFEDIDVIESDYDDKEYKFDIRVKVDDDTSNDKKYFIFSVEVEDGDAEIVDVNEE